MSRVRIEIYLPVANKVEDKINPNVERMIGRKARADIWRPVEVQTREAIGGRIYRQLLQEISHA